MYIRTAALIIGIVICMVRADELPVPAEGSGGGNNSQRAEPLSVAGLGPILKIPEETLKKMEELRERLKVHGPLSPFKLNDGFKLGASAPHIMDISVDLPQQHVDNDIIQPVGEGAPNQQGRHDDADGAQRPADADADSEDGERK